jgi:hypothetical protein
MWPIAKVKTATMIIKKPVIKENTTLNDIKNETKPKAANLSLAHE